MSTAQYRRISMALMRDGQVTVTIVAEVADLDCLHCWIVSSVRKFCEFHGIADIDGGELLGCLGMVIWQAFDQENVPKEARSQILEHLVARIKEGPQPSGPSVRLH